MAIDALVNNVVPVGANSIGANSLNTEPNMSGWQKFLAGLKSFFIGNPAMLHQIENFTPEQLNTLQQILGQGSEMMQNPYAGFSPIAQQATEQFQKNIVPSLAERFAGSGRNALGSGAFASQLGQSASDLASNLAALQSQYGLQNRSQALGYLGLGLQPHYSSLTSNAQEGMLQPLLSGAAKIGMQAAMGGIPGLGMAANLAK